MSKYPLEKLIYFLAALIPGFTALLIFELAHPGCFNWFFALPFAGYRTKIVLVLAAAFVGGYSIITLLGYFLTSVGGMVGALMPYEASHLVPWAPWRDPKWRSAVKRYLGADAPEDKVLIKADYYEWKKENMISLLPEDQQGSALAALRVEQIESEMNDSHWERWYDHFDRLVRQEKTPVDWTTQMRHGLEFNFKATALYVLISAIWVPAVRHWWCILPASLWTIFFVLKEWVDVQSVRNKWWTLSAQIKYLLEREPLSQQKALFPPSPTG